MTTGYPTPDSLLDMLKERGISWNLSSTADGFIVVTLKKDDAIGISKRKKEKYHMQSDFLNALIALDEQLENAR